MTALFLTEAQQILSVCSPYTRSLKLC